MPDPTTEFSPAAQKELLLIARQSVEAAVKGFPPPPLELEHEELKLKRGAFVTLTNKGELRGCIGLFEADQPLCEVVREMGRAAAREDTRFAANPIRVKELPELSIEISVLSPRRRVKNPLEEIVIGRDGIYIKRGGRSGTFLPQVATEYNMGKEEFLSTCCSHKCGLSPDAWKDPATEVYVYSAQIFSEKHE